MNLDHVAVLEHVVALHRLTVEAAATPDAGELEVGGNVPMDDLGEVHHIRTTGDDEGFFQVRLVPWGLRVHADDTERVEEGPTQRFEPCPRRGGDDVQRRGRDLRPEK